MSRIREVFSLFRATFLVLFLLIPIYFIIEQLHLKAEHDQRIVLRNWARSDYALLSLNRALRILPLPALQSRKLTPEDLRLIQGWSIQGEVALQDLKKSRSLFSGFQRDELDRLEKNFRTFKTLLFRSTLPPLLPRSQEKKNANPESAGFWTLERQLDLSLSVLSLSVRSSREKAERKLADIETKWERGEGGILFGFLVILLVFEGWSLKKAHEESQSKGAQLHAVFNAMQDTVIYAGLDRRILFANPAVEKIFGYPPSEVIGQSAAIFYSRKEDFEKQGELRYHPGGSDDSESYEMVYRRKNGSLFTGEAQGAVVRDAKNMVQGFIVTVRDITQRKEMLDRLYLEKEKWFITLGSIGDAVIVTDLETRVEYMNSIAETLTGFSLRDAAGKAVGEVFDIVNEMTREPVENPIDKSLRLGSVVGLANHTVLLSRSGKEYAIEDSAAPIRSGTGEVIGCVVVFRDVTEKRNLLHKVAHQANYDALTDLPNRYLFQDRMVQLFGQARRLEQAVAMIYLDVDHFKKINDTLGHPFGDLVLKEVGRRIRSAVRGSDTVARLGGDEFAIVAPVELSSPDHIAILTRKIQEVMALPFQIEDQELHLSASIGVAIFPEDGPDPTTLIRNADIALYHAKEQGRNNVQFFSPLLNLTVQERTEMETHLHTALGMKEFEVCYQPVVDLDRGTIVGVEALLRWHHPQRGLVGPDRFIPLAEDSGLIIPIGEWVMETACRQALEWQNLGNPSLRLAVNVSALQLTRGDFPGFLNRCLQITGFPSDCLELELTESVLLQKSGKVTEALVRLHAMGVRISVDDFGTGYSSLSYLTRFQVNTLKIDGSFVRGIASHSGNAAVITAILALGKAMSLDVIAEGVETVEQVRFLKNHHCRLLQGFLFSHPVSANKIPEILAKNYRKGEGVLSGLGEDRSDGEVPPI